MRELARSNTGCVTDRTHPCASFWRSQPRIRGCPVAAKPSVVLVLFECRGQLGPRLCLCQAITNRLLKCRKVLVIRTDTGVQLKGVPVVSWNNVEMQMKDGLPCSLLVELNNLHTGGAKLVSEGASDMLYPVDERGEL